MISVVRWIAGVATTVALALGGVVVALVVLPTTQAHALTCDTSWKTAASGDWALAANWTGGVPTATTNACITLAGTYTVTINGLAAQAKTITLGNTTGATTQTLAISGLGCTGPASLNLAATGSTVKKTGTALLTSTTCSGDVATLNVGTTHTLTNTGVIDVEVGTGGARALLGQITNKGTLTVNANTSLQAGTAFTNQGAINIADGVTLAVDAVTGPPTSSFFNDAGGKINSSGTSMTGILYMNGGNSFNEGAGTTNVANTYVDNSTLTYSGSGVSQIFTRDTGTLTGAPSAGQVLTIQGTGCGAAAAETLTGSATNAGTITLSSNPVCSGNPASLTVAAGTLTSTGTLDSEPGNGGSRTITGSVINQGAVTVNVTTTISGGWDNKGPINIADSVTLSVVTTSSTTFTNDSGGSVNTSGSAATGDLYINPGNTFVEGAGTTTGGPAYVDGSALSYTGSGASQLVARETGTLTGAPSVGQALTIQGTGCNAAAAETMTGSATNAGTITLSSNPVCSGNAASLTVTAGTLTSTGTLDSEPGNGGGRTITGAVINQGTFTVNASTTFSGSWDNKGAATIADSVTLSIPATSSTTFTNDTGGSVNTSGSATTGDLYINPGNTFVNGAGTTTGGPAYVDGSALSYTGSGASQLIARETGTLTGAPSVSQGLTIQGTGCSAAAVETLTGSATNAGTITLGANTACSGNNVTLAIPTGSLLTNNGTLSTLLGNGGARTITGDITNSSAGTISIAAKTTYKPAALFTNQGTVATTAPLAIVNVKTSVVYDAAGTMKGSISINKGTFKQGNGVLKNPVGVSFATTNFVGTGKGTVISKNTGGILEGTLVSGQLYTMQGAGCGAAAAVSTSGAVVNGGIITLTANTACSGNNDTLTIPTGSSLANSGSIVTTAGNGGARIINGTLTNTGTVTINTATSISGTWDNKGSVTIADSTTLSLPGSAGATFTNDSGGSVVTTGDATTGDLFVNIGNTLVEGAGTTSGGPVYLDDAALSYTGAGASQFVVRGGSSTLSGGPSAGQTLNIQGTGCSEAAVLTAAGSFTNHGTIILSADTVCGGSNTALTLPSGATLTNSGMLQMVAGNGGTRTLNGNLDNRGTVGITNGPTLTVNGNFTNEAAGTVAVSVPTSTPTLTISGTATISGGTLKAVPQTGSTFTPGQMFPAISAGTVTGTFTTVTGGAGQTWTALYTPTTVTLNYVGP